MIHILQKLFGGSTKCKTGAQKQTTTKLKNKGKKSKRKQPTPLSPWALAHPAGPTSQPAHLPHRSPSPTVLLARPLQGHVPVGPARRRRPEGIRAPSPRRLEPSRPLTAPHLRPLALSLAHALVTSSRSIAEHGRCRSPHSAMASRHISPRRCVHKDRRRPLRLLRRRNEPEPLPSLSRPSASTSGHRRPPPSFCCTEPPPSPLMHICRSAVSNNVDPPSSLSFPVPVDLVAAMVEPATADELAVVASAAVACARAHRRAPAIPKGPDVRTHAAH